LRAPELPEADSLAIGDLLDAIDHPTPFVDEFDQQGAWEYMAQRIPFPLDLD
jgi:hypothetical protein